MSLSSLPPQMFGRWRISDLRFSYFLKKWISTWLHLYRNNLNRKHKSGDVMEVMNAPSLFSNTVCNC